MAIRLSASSKNTWGLQRISNAKPTIIPHRGITVMVMQTRKETIGSWDELAKQFVGNFKSTYKRPASNKELKACIQKSGQTLYSYI
jgi:hypothetical protein